MADVSVRAATAMSPSPPHPATERTTAGTTAARRASTASNAPRASSHSRVVVTKYAGPRDVAVRFTDHSSDGTAITSNPAVSRRVDTPCRAHQTSATMSSGQMT